MYLAATMRRGADLVRRLEQFGIRDAQLRAAKSRAEEVGFADARSLTIELVFAHFGRPTLAEGNQLLYDLVLWPEHRFEWRGLEWGGAAHEGFMLREAPTLPVWVPLSLSSLRKTFTTWHHTRHEIQEVLGEPTLDLSWGELGEWYYGPAVDGSEIVMTFDYGLLRSIELSHGVIARAKSQ